MIEQESVQTIPNSDFIQPHEALKPRERISDIEIGNLLAAIGNSEAKALLLVLMDENEIYTSYGLQKTLLNAQGDNIAWNIGKNSPREWCTESLAPIGLVANEVIDEYENVHGYTKTDYGNTTGTALAGLLLQFSAEHPNISLQQLYGSTQSNSKQRAPDDEIDFKKRSPFIRNHIFYQLCTSPLPIRLIDIERAISEELEIPTNSTIGNHIKTLSEQGILEYQITDARNDRIHYQVNLDTISKALEYIRGLQQTNQDICALLFSDPNKIWTITELHTAYLEKLNDEHGVSHTSVRSLLAKLKRLGYLFANEHSDFYMSTIDMAPEQLTTLSELLEILHSFQNQDPAIIQQGLGYGAYLRTNPEKVSELMQKRKDTSPYANMINSDIAISHVLQILQAGELNTDTIRTALAEHFNKRFDRNTIGKILRKIQQKGLISSRKGNKTMNYWSLTTNT